LGSVTRSSTRPASPSVAEGRSSRPAFDPRLDTPIVGGRNPTQALKEAIKQNSGGNPVMADILADTAMTTLPNQLSNGDSMGMPGLGTTVNRAPLQEQFSGEVDDVFGDVAAPRADGSSYWSDLAFMPSKKSA
jgi:hypothetical protein